MRHKLQKEWQLLMYIKHPVGIGEHPQHLEEIDKLLDKIKEAEEKISLINRLELTKGSIAEGEVK